MKSTLLVALLALSLLPASLRADDPLAFDAGEWDVPTHGAFITAMACADGKGYVATEDQGLWVRDNGQWHTLAPPSISGDSLRSIAVDRQHRLWIGSGHHGVFIYNGKDWYNYDAPQGPLGHRVFRIAISPLDGDVWLATELGLTRYSVADDRWSHITRADGLPADQINAIAFDPKGTLYVATQCDGLAIGSAGDQYTTWRTITGPDRETTEQSGAGLPSNLLNDVLVSGDGAVFVATCAGLAQSLDQGATWTYYRGEDFVDKVKNRTGGPPAGWKEPANKAFLSEDYVTCLAQNAAGNLWIGHRLSGYEVLDLNTLQRLAGSTSREMLPDYVQCIAPASPTTMWIGTYGAGPIAVSAKVVAVDDGNKPLPAVADAKTTSLANLPALLKIRPSEWDALATKVHSLKPAPLTAAYLGDDWVTQGDGVGRYGKQKMAFPFYGLGGWANGYDFNISVGPHGTDGTPSTYYSSESDQRSPYIPNAFARTPGEWNDGSYADTPWAQEGPDLWLSITVPEGVQRLTLLFLNYDAHKGMRNRVRDMTIEVKPWRDNLADADFAPAIAKARVQDFYEPVYKQFLLAGGNKYLVKINRNHGFEAKISGLFFDRVKGGAKADIDSLPFPLLDEKHWGPMPIADVDANKSASVAQARALFDDMDAHWDDGASVSAQLPARLLAFRLAEQQGADPSLLANWRWKLGLWNEDDRVEFCRQMDAGYDKTVANNPRVADKPRISMIDQYLKDHPDGDDAAR